MASFDNVIKYDEMIIFDLRRLYSQHGYSRYKMSKFEEYDLYVRNKDFLISDGIITFTDTSGKLLALKPDVTLSIIKNAKHAPGTVRKVCYNENVYRVSKGTDSFKEIMQVGLECFGDVDMFNICEVITLAAKSLEKISPDFILNISHLGVLSAILDRMELSSETRDRIIECIGRKSLHELNEVCSSISAEQDYVSMLNDIMTAGGEPYEVINKLSGRNRDVDLALLELETVCHELYSAGLLDKVNIDFSLVSDVNYYNGIVFRGFIEDVPTAVLSGGQYDKLMEKLGKTAGAIGFAIYLDALEHMHSTSRKYDFDVLLLYDENTDKKALSRAVESLIAQGESVSAQRNIPDKLKFRRTVRLVGKELKEI